MPSIMQHDKENVGSNNIKESGDGMMSKKISHGSNESTMRSSSSAATAATSSETTTSRSNLGSSKRPLSFQPFQPFQQQQQPPPPPPAYRRTRSKQQLITTSLIDADLLMVSPPSYNPNGGRQSYSSRNSFTPTNSETILSAFRQVEHTLNAEIHTVQVLASAGTGKKSRRRCFAEEEEEGDGGGMGSDGDHGGIGLHVGGSCGLIGGSLHYATSPETDVDTSPIPPSFPPMPSLSSPMSSGSDDSDLVEFRYSPTATTTRTATASASATATATSATSMEYSTIGNIITTATSPLMNRSLLPMLTTLEEEQNQEEQYHSDDGDDGSDVSEEVEITIPPNNDDDGDDDDDASKSESSVGEAEKSRLETGGGTMKRSDDVNDKNSPDSVERKTNSNDETNSPSEEVVVEFHETLSWNATLETSRRAKPETEKEDNPMPPSASSSDADGSPHDASRTMCPCVARLYDRVAKHHANNPERRNEDGDDGRAAAPDSNPDAARDASSRAACPRFARLCDRIGEWILGISSR